MEDIFFCKEDKKERITSKELRNRIKLFGFISIFVVAFGIPIFIGGEVTIETGAGMVFWLFGNFFAIVALITLKRNNKQQKYILPSDSDNLSVTQTNGVVTKINGQKVSEYGIFLKRKSTKKKPNIIEILPIINHPDFYKISNHSDWFFENDENGEVFFRSYFPFYINIPQYYFGAEKNSSSARVENLTFILEDIVSVKFEDKDEKVTFTLKSPLSTILKETYRTAYNSKKLNILEESFRIKGKENYKRLKTNLTSWKNEYELSFSINEVENEI